MTAMAYPDGYEWRADSDMESTSCFIIVFSDGIPVLRIPAGDRYQVPTDPQRHRVIGGHLYTDWSDGLVTVIKRDGKEIFRYSGSETIVRMLIHEGRVHTLSTIDGTSGFSYRVDGEAVLQREDARLFEHLDLCGNKVGFCFSCLVSEASGRVRRYYSVLDGSVVMVDLEGDVWDMKMYADGLYVLISDGSSPLPVLMKDGAVEVPKPFLGTEFRSAEFLDSDVMCVNIRYFAPEDSAPTSLLWFGKGQWRQFLFEKTAIAIWTDGVKVCMAYNHSDGDSGKIFVDSEMFDMPSGYDVRGLNPVACGDSGVQIGLTSASGGPPAIWMDGEVREVDINGYIVKASSSDDVSG